MRKRKRVKEELGQGMVEFALIFPIFLMIVMFIVDAGWVAAQRTAFENGYIHSSWSVSAAEVGDYDTLEETPSRKVYSNGVDDALMDNIRESNIWGLIPNNVAVLNAQATCFNKEETFDVPGRDGEAVQAVSRTRFMDLNANIRYDIYPLTFIGKMIFGNRVTLQKTYQTTKVVASQHSSK